MNGLSETCSNTGMIEGIKANCGKERRKRDDELRKG